MSRKEIPKYIKDKDRTKSRSNSIFQVDAKNFYHFEKLLGKGNWAYARLFSNKQGDKVVVLSCLKPGFFPEDTKAYYGWTFDEKDDETIKSYMAEVRNKQKFYESVYPKELTYLSIDDSNPLDYRLIVPFLGAESFEDAFKDCNRHECISKLLALWESISAVHDKGKIIYDITEDNIVFDTSSKKFNFIDGGSSMNYGKHIEPYNTQKNEKKNDTESALQIHQSPPELYSKKNKIKIKYSLDVYFLGFYCLRVIKENKAELTFPEYNYLYSIFKNCLHENPDKRITVPKIISTLTQISKNKSNLDSLFLKLTQSISAYKKTRRGLFSMSPSPLRLQSIKKIEDAFLENKRNLQGSDDITDLEILGLVLQEKNLAKKDQETGFFKKSGYASALDSVLKIFIRTEDEAKVCIKSYNDTIKLKNAKHADNLSESTSNSM